MDEYVAIEFRRRWTTRCGALGAQNELTLLPNLLRIILGEIWRADADSSIEIYT